MLHGSKKEMRYGMRMDSLYNVFQYCLMLKSQGRIYIGPTCSVQSNGVDSTHHPTGRQNPIEDMSSYGIGVKNKKVTPICKLMVLLSYYCV